MEWKDPKWKQQKEAKPCYLLHCCLIQKELDHLKSFALIWWTTYDLVLALYSRAIHQGKKVGKRRRSCVGRDFLSRPNGGNKRHKLLQIGPFQERSQINRLQLIVKFTIDRAVKGGRGLCDGLDQRPGKNSRQSKDRIAVQFSAPKYVVVESIVKFPNSLVHKWVWEPD